jgi:hypothetical protein
MISSTGWSAVHVAILEQLASWLKASKPIAGSGEEWHSDKRSRYRDLAETIS